MPRTGNDSPAECWSVVGCVLRNAGSSRPGVKEPGWLPRGKGGAESC